MLSHLNLSFACTENSLVPNTYASQSSYHFMKCYRLCLKIAHVDSHLSPGLVFVRSFKGLQLCKAQDEASNSSESKDQLNSNYLENNLSDKNIHLNDFVFEKRSDKDKNEMQRREKIGLAIKGRVPWNKGKKHTLGTLATYLYPNDSFTLLPEVFPKTASIPSGRNITVYIPLLHTRQRRDWVRKKMSECPRTLSEKTKEKIRITITQQWRERLIWKRARERFIYKWAESIAKAAKKGGHGQEELEWDSYEKIEKEIGREYLQRSADVAKAKEMAQLRAERRAKAKAEKKKLNLQKRVEKVKGLAKKKSKEEKNELAATEDLKLKERLTKIHRKKTVNDQLSSRDHRAWERLDLEILKRDIKKEAVSLADQIREVKNKKANVFIREAFATTTPHNRPSV